MTKPSIPLIEVLSRCRARAKVSQDAAWSNRGVAEILGILDRGVEAIERGTELNREELKLLFAPTGDLQELSIANGWEEDYLLLSARFDDLVE